MENKNDKMNEFIKMASEIKSECEKISECDCQNEKCPYTKDGYCMFEEIFGNSPCNWDLKGGAE